MKAIILSALPLILSLMVTPVSAQTNHTRLDQRFHQIVDDTWAWWLEDAPVFATHVGEHRYGDRLADMSPQAHAKRAENLSKLLKRLRSVPKQDLSIANQVNYRVLELSLERRLESYRFDGHLAPITNRSGFHISFTRLPDHVPLATVADYDAYITRLEAFYHYADQHIALLRAGLSKGITVPKITLKGYEETITPHIVDDPTKSQLWRPMNKMPDSFSKRERDRLTTRAQAAIKGSVVPGYKQFQSFMLEHYLPGARTSIAASALPQGREYYRAQVRRHTTLNQSPEAIHATGLSEVARIRAEMKKVIKSTAFKGSFSDFLTFLRTDPQFYATTPHQLMAEVALVLKRMDGRLPQLFKTLPRTPYGLEPIPDFLAPRTTTAYYQPGSGDGRVAGTYRVNTYKLETRPLYEIEALSLHEAVPGHHLQWALQQEMNDLPDFRRFVHFTAFGEGWALYAERLGLEVGFYKDPYRNFGRLTYEMWRACRLVVDTGIHWLGWTRKKAIDYMAKHTALSLHNIETEIDRYIAWPGQALAYKLGELEIRRLRTKAEKTLGKAFDIRAFHDAVLGQGSVPLDVLATQVDRYLEAASSK